MVFDIKETVKDVTKEMSEKQKENRMNTMLLILRCRVNGNDLEVRGHDAGKLVDTFEALKKNSQNKLTEGNLNESQNNE